MHEGKLVFAQVTGHLPLTTFGRCVARYGGSHKIKSFSCLDQYLCMAFAQLTYRESLRDIEACLRAQQSKLYHMGIKSRVSRSTLADANESRDWRIYADFAQSLIGIARRLYATEPFGVDLNDTVYALDASTIDLCLSVFPWAPVSLDQGSRQIAHSLGFAWQHSFVPAYQRWQTARRQRSRSVAARARRFLHHGSRLHRLRSTLSIARGQMFLCHPGQVQSQSPAALLASYRSQHWLDLRSDCRADRLLLQTRFRHAASSSPLQRSYDRQRFGVPHQQFHLASIDHHGAVSLPLASRIVFQMDQATFASQSFLRNHRERSQNTNLDRCVGLRARGDHQKRLNLSASLYEILQILSLTMFERFPLDQLLSKIVTEQNYALSLNQLNLFN